jgi:hypothetical protein
MGIEKPTNVVALSYTHEHSVDSYVINSLGEDFEVDIPPQNVLMCVCAYNIARTQKEIGGVGRIITVGGTAKTNKKILERMNSITGDDIEIISLDKSNSIGTNISSLSKIPGYSIILSQEFAKQRTYRHSKHYFDNEDFTVKAWEEHIDYDEEKEEIKFSELEKAIIGEVADKLKVPYNRTIVELGLMGLALVNPSGSMIQWVANIREKLRKKKPKKNIFTETGTD